MSGHILTPEERLIATLRYDIDAYRGALGYPVPGYHDGRLSNGDQPRCGLCDARSKPVLSYEPRCLRCGHSIRDHNMLGLAECYGDLPTGGLCQCIAFTTEKP